MSRSRQTQSNIWNYFESNIEYKYKTWNKNYSHNGRIHIRYLYNILNIRICGCEPWKLRIRGCDPSNLPIRIDIRGCEKICIHNKPDIYIRFPLHTEDELCEHRFRLEKISSLVLLLFSLTRCRSQSQTISLREKRFHFKESQHFWDSFYSELY